jgi:ABC-type sugar transport system ATPase subunit
MATLQLRDLAVAGAVTSGSTAAVLRVSVTVAAGEVVAVVAEPSPATALARVVVGLSRPLSGRVLVGDRDVTELPPAARQIGYVPAGGALLPHLTVRQNIRYLLKRREAVRDLTRSWEAMLIHQLELAPLLDRRSHELSSDQRIRTAVARAVLVMPEVLTLDVPTAPATWSLRDLLARIQTQDTAGPSTVVFSAADTVIGEADRAVPAESGYDPGHAAAPC